MDTWEAATAVFERVRALDPGHAAKIVGLLLVHDDGDKRALARLAAGPDHLLRSFVARARAELLAASKASSSPSPRADDDRVLQASCDAAPHPDHCWSPVSGGLRRSLSLSDAGGRVPHTLQPEEEGSVAVMRRAKSMSARPPPPPRLADPAFFASSFSPSPNGRNDEYVFPQQQSDAQRSPAAAAAGMLQLGGGEDLMMSRFSSVTMRSPRMTTDMDLMHSPAALQIYMTFPAEPTFTEDDVSNYFSKYGPVQDVRIPYQQRRMFGFVTFVYPETVRTVLSMRNPHLVCAARVLVKPYKEKSKVLLHRKLSSRPHHGEFAATATGLFDPRDAARFDDLHQPQIGPRNIASQQEAVLRRKLLEEQQQQQQAADELQRTIELLQSRHFIGLQLLDLNSRAHRLGSPVITSPISPGQTDGGKGSVDGDGNNAVRLEGVVVSAENKLNSGSSVATCAPAFPAVSGTAAEGKGEEQQKEAEDGDGTPQNAVNPAGAGEEKRGSGLVTAAAPNAACGGFQESGVVDHSLPASLLDDDCAGATAQNDDMGPYHVAYSLFPPRSSLDLPPNNSCFFQLPRFTSGHEAIEL